MKKDKFTIARAIVAIVFALLIYNFLNGIFDNDDKVTKETKTDQTITKGSSSDKEKSLESYVKNNSNLGDFEYDSDLDIYIVSGDLNNIISDKNAIEGFNDTIYDTLREGIKTDKPVLFRGWYEHHEEILPGALIYFSVDNFNRNWSEESFDSTTTYQFSDGWQTTSKFGQYLSKTSSATDEIIEETIFKISMISKQTPPK
ncbi:hypothetical protein [Streptococcus pluranimalium]|uniref:Uncharacterized protein n=1 Tax=Streptococcus pluranimalium TaxID=82348 RepID=A0A345VLS0_9STRE|nr:hypothetical protein [Streptococcus pluranimalium]AXJ13672.1 hypothetical protein Sp14A_17650 [Streptococcus pluranimalium]